MSDNSIGQQFMLHTQIKKLGESDQQKGLPQPPLEKAVSPATVRIALPSIDTIPNYLGDFTTAVRQRRTLRKYSDTPLTLEELTYLLWCTQGLHRTVHTVTLRSVPSAGARHPIETYLMINKVDGLKPGLYRYLAMSHELAEVNLQPGICAQIVDACGPGQKFMENSAVSFLWVAVPYRTSWRYGERAYRYIHLDAGHICQNLYLAAQIIGCGSCAVAAFDDESLNSVLGLDGVSEFIVYAAPVGKVIK
jgi:SagB-type dehydrogenase family enzyme